MDVVHNMLYGDERKVASPREGVVKGINQIRIPRGILQELVRQWPIHPQIMTNYILIRLRTRRWRSGPGLTFRLDRFPGVSRDDRVLRNAPVQTAQPVHLRVQPRARVQLVRFEETTAAAAAASPTSRPARIGTSRRRAVGRARCAARRAAHGGATR